PHMVDDQDLVGQIEDEVALILGARQFEPHRLELEDQVVAERAVEAEVLVLRTSEQVVQGAQHRKDAGLAAALFLREMGIALAYRAGDAVLAEMGNLDSRETAERLADIEYQHPSALVQRLDREPAAARREYQRRID